VLWVWGLCDKPGDLSVVLWLVFVLEGFWVSGEALVGGCGFFWEVGTLGNVVGGCRGVVFDDCLWWGRFCVGIGVVFLCVWAGAVVMARWFYVYCVGGV